MNNKASNVLVLNRNFLPIHIIEWKKAMSLIYQASANALDQDFVTYHFNDWLEYSNRNDLDKEYPSVHTVNKKIFIPEIIVLTKYDHLPLRDVKFSRQNLFEVFNYHCAYCMNTFSKNDLTVDHVIPRSKGGLTTWENTVACCIPCNRLKADRLLHECGLTLKKKPKKPRWISPLSGIRKTNSRKSWSKFMLNSSVDLG